MRFFYESAFNQFSQTYVIQIGVDLCVIHPAEFRVSVDERNEKVGRKIRDNELKRIPYMLIVGEKEAENGEVSVRKQGGGDQFTLTVDEFGKSITDEVDRIMKEALSL